uniref:DUF3421 domain-containing protein n=2 Tax=Macrostomum lignano TaxID=282301 RepID=A0A1I8IS49_9PLAT
QSMSIYKSSSGKGVDLCLSWIRAANGEIPDGAVCVGGDVFVARCLHEREQLPGKVANGHQFCFAPYGTEEKTYTDYQVLCETVNVGLSGSPGYQWVPWSGGSDEAPKYALIGGSDQGKPVYVARATVNGEWCSGKYIPEFGKAYFSYGGSEHELDEGFDVLVMKC